MQNERNLRHDPEKGDSAPSGRWPVGGSVGRPRDVQCGHAQSEAADDGQLESKDSAPRTNTRAAALLAPPQRYAQTSERGWWCEWGFRHGRWLTRLTAVRPGHI